MHLIFITYSWIYDVLYANSNAKVRDKTIDLDRIKNPSASDCTGHCCCTSIQIKTKDNSDTGMEKWVNAFQLIRAFGLFGFIGTKPNYIFLLKYTSVKTMS